MPVSPILEVEASVFVYGLALIVAWKLVTSAINMRGLLMDKSQPWKVSPERVQLLVSTIVLAMQYLREASVTQYGSLPQLGPGWLYLFGGSSLIYSIRKGVEKYKATNDSDK